MSWGLILLFVTTACKKTEVVDSADFTLYYTGMTDIGPSMTGIISSPSFIGGTPSDFKIVRITLDDVAYSGGGFEIDPEKGEISVRETAGMPVGLYKLTISCSANGIQHEFADIVEVNMMKPVPDGIAVVPNKLTVDYGDVIDATSEVELPTAQVTTDGDHVSIRKYEIAQSDFSKYFDISSTGLISIVRGDNTLVPGKYVLSLKLTTGASGEDEGIFENAIEINITSKPLALTYAPASGKIEEETALSGKTTYTSTVPVLKGSPDDLVYTLKSVTPATDKIKIDPQTGVISVAQDHGLVAGEEFQVSVNVKNIYSAEGVDFENVFLLQVVEFIEPIQGFAYPNVQAIQAVPFDNDLNPGFKGDEVRFEFVDLPAALQGNISIDLQGKISAERGNTIPIGSYTVRVKATNPKSEEANPTIASFTLTVSANPNFFTFVRYGNNLGLTPAENYANQFRIAAGTSTAGFSSGVAETDATVSLVYEISQVHQAGGASINSTTGEITLGGSNPKTSQCAIIMVTATAGKGTPSEYSVKTPIFFHNSEPVNSVLVEYSPFVFQVNPNSGGHSANPVITGVSDMSNFFMDYRRTFNYYNFFGTHMDGQPSVEGSLMRQLFKNYADSKGTNPNYGSKDALSYYSNTGNLSLPLAYVDPNTYSVVVNPNRWIADGEPANGTMIGQITFSSDLTTINNGSQIFPIVLWFDTKF
ncbi:DUF4958 domain-containing protein [Sphingobacterium sp. SGG-5]|uniref:surface glycan-binding family protein n=1 Tax=Sphingobacterium sp. SGG-5 TaxID=2710881 RepID=UPI0013ED8D3B|nr:surface glycan-binding family protein [Sphingobacterium sp. SGG-5]NGM62856.1 DUF4958 domain-containing protein [Sphingobacterium sp. SGG-5]